MNHFVRIENQLKAIFIFKTFIEAIDFVNQVADLAEQADHHPEIVINYKQVTLFLTTHEDGNQVTQKDWDLANKIEALNPQ